MSTMPMTERTGRRTFGRRVPETWALSHIRSVIYGGGGRWYLKPTSKFNQTRRPR